MTFDEAAQVLERAGLQVSCSPSGLVAVAGPEDPHPLVAAQGVEKVFAFGFSIARHGDAYFFRHARPPARATEMATLEEAVAHGTGLFEAHLAGQATRAPE